jgi:hypothetical protein
MMIRNLIGLSSFPQFAPKNKPRMRLHSDDKRASVEILGKDRASGGSPRVRQIFQ